ncbi:serine-rich coiled-coil domain-containing protein 2 isoform X4 [Alligator sinensis]|uniref:Serine-rich coiled-coil domain-containing protein 2 isoform X4 n=1 Tax=Alligator sinensis TaxID=38654 RepID=A0A1U7SI64_ALLSI|nr:serine-rich coiled-coil domain-containing protein 2 isoform X4 [Alligator sinensis]
MEEKNYIRTSLVSRLPKYETKSLGNVLQPLSNGTTVNLSGTTQSNNGKSGTKHNGTVHMSSSFNWRKSNKYQLCNQRGGESNFADNSNEKISDSEKYSQSRETFGKDVHRVGLDDTALLASKTSKQTNMFVSSTKELNPKSLPVLSSSAKFSKGTLLGRTSYSGLNAPKSRLDGFYGNRSSVGLQRPRVNSGATRNSSGEGLAQSTDNETYSCEKMVRSQSFSHSIQNSFLPPASLTRSHSFNRAVDLTRPYQNQHLAIRSSQRATLLSRNTRQLNIPSGNEPLKYGFTRAYNAISTCGSKKTLLSNESGAAAALEYQMSRPSFLKRNGQQFTGKITVGDSKSTATDSGFMDNNSEISTNSKEMDEKKDAMKNDSHRKEGSEILHDSLGKHNSKVLCMSDDVDEISISSLSSCEKNDLSEDFSDDCIDLEDPNRMIEAHSEEVFIQELEHGATPIESFSSLKESESSHCNADDWLDIAIHVSANDKNQSTTHTSGTNLMSPDMNYRAGSSSELSPSDSSDGTYMWDEEGLEPIGSVHPCGSYESSEMNSIDILNNLDSCDLEDDDLMLDVDLPEDAPCENVECKNMNRYDRQDRNARKQSEGFWKRAQQCWSAQDHYHLGHHYLHGKNDISRGSKYAESPVGHFESYGTPNFYQAPRQFVGLPENTVMLDEMTLRHMVQDCTAVKTQLLKLKRLLQQNDESVSLQDIPFSVLSSPEPQDAESPCKTEDLLNEIKQLKDEVKKQDETIKRLEHQLTTRCNCHKDSQKPKGATCMLADKFTQTSWRKSSPQVLQPSNSLPNTTDLAQGKLIKMSHIEAPSEYHKHGLHENGDHQNKNAADTSHENSLNEQNLLLSIRLGIKDLNENAFLTENMEVKKSAKEPREMASNEGGTLRSHDSSFQTPAHMNTRKMQTKLAVRSKQLSMSHASWPKTVRITKPPSQNALVSPTMAVLEPSPASKEPEIPPSSSPIHLQPTSSQANLKSKQSQKMSKLCPATVFLLKSKQVTIPKCSFISQEPQNTSSKTSIPRPLTQRKENMQNQNIRLHSGDSLASNRHSRLPKPKTHY